MRGPATTRAVSSLAHLAHRRQYSLAEQRQPVWKFFYSLIEGFSLEGRLPICGAISHLSGDIEKLVAESCYDCAEAAL